MKMKNSAVAFICGVAVAVGAYVFWRHAAPSGPYGGALIPIDGGAAYAEVLARAENGEAMVLTWDNNLKQPHPIAGEPLILGSGPNRLILTPDPTDKDPPGFCSRFCGQADWLKDGRAHHGWLDWPGHAEHHHPFTWDRCWDAGQAHGSIWHGTGAHHGQGMGHTPGHHGGNHHE